MRRLKKALDCALAALGFGLISGWAHADVVMLGIPDGAPGQVIELSIQVTAGSLLTSFDIAPAYSSFAQVVTLVDIKPTSALDQFFGGCGDDGTCGYFSLEGDKSFAVDTVLATLRFRVTDDAESYVDTTGNRGYPFDLGVLVDGEHPLLPVDQIFTVLPVPVPEPSTWCLTAVGMLLLIANRFRRSPYGSRGTTRGADRLPG